MSGQTSKSAKKRILLVEDDQFLLELYAAKLKSAGFAVEIAQNGERALEQMEKFRPDLVLLDVVIPEPDGLAVLKSIRGNFATKNLKVIILTNLGQQEEIERGLNLGANDYLIKAHLTPSEIVFKVNQTLNEIKV